ncbi:hypothetical protein V6N12_040441 [Hibiscus sabdariffa]|uniref:Uncharacterized protein n=1 Tax=Hibiscus sabdariffa TaxID=183260 RepID=A0ABR2E3M9_9ROSI
MKVISRVSVGLGSYFVKFGPCKMAELGLDQRLQSDGSDRFWQFGRGTVEKTKEAFSTHQPKREITLLIQGNASSVWKLLSIHWPSLYLGLVVKSEPRREVPTAEAGRGIGGVCLGSFSSEIVAVLEGHRGENKRSLFNSPTKGRDSTVDPRQCKLQSGNSDLSTGQVFI